MSCFRYIFGTYINQYIKEIGKPALIEEWKLNLDTAVYKNKINADKRIPQEKKTIDCRYSHELRQNIMIEDMQ